MFLFLCKLLILFSNVNCDERFPYEGQQFWHVQFLNKELKSAFELNFTDKYNVLSQSRNSIDIIVEKGDKESLLKELEKHQANYTIFNENIQESINNETKFEQPTRKLGAFFASLPSFSEIEKFMRELVKAKPEACSIRSLGTTAQKRQIWMLKVSNGRKENSAFLIESGMQGKDWTSIMANLYLMYQIAGNFQKQSEYMKEHDWYFIPVLNPDGFEYTKTNKRLWRKNRRVLSGSCYGVNIAENFGKVGVTSTCSHPDICSDRYCGPTPFSEQESKAIKTLLEERNFYVYFSLSSYGGNIIVPRTANGAGTMDLKDHLEVAKVMVEDMSDIHKRKYQGGTVSQLGLPQRPHSSVDWAYDMEPSVKYSFIVQPYGTKFFDNQGEIFKVCDEVYAGVQGVGNFLT